ncbi:MAG: hypothetical protein ACRCWD_02900 [Culicoidibacterales bacterium]
MILITFADQSVLQLPADTTLTFWMHSQLKLAFERGMEQSMIQFADVCVADLSHLTFLALLKQSACFTLNTCETEYFFSTAVVKVNFPTT